MAKASAKEKGRKRLVLIDSHAILHRAYHAIPDFETSQGVPTGALYGLITMLLKVIDDLSPDYVVAARDLPGDTFRDGIYADYKGHRAEADEALIGQLQKAPGVFEAFGIPVYAAPGFEADDCIGTIVEKLKGSDVDVVIATGDLDTLQLVEGDRVQVYTLRQGLNDTILYDEDRVRERFGFGPEYVVDYKALRGDPSDNIKGVKGIGEKSAEQLITTLGSIEDIYAALEKNPESLEKNGIKKRVVSLLQEGAEDAKLSKTLATIRRDAPIDFQLPAEEWHPGNHIDSIDRICDEYEFRTIKERLHRGLKNLDAADVAAEEPDEDVDPQRLREAAIQLWLLHSDMTEPTLQQILDYAQMRRFAEAEKWLEDKLRKTGRLWEVYERIEKPLIPIVQSMNAHGVMLDREALGKLAKEYRDELGKIAGRIYNHAGHEFNIQSTRQLATVLYDELHIKPEKQKTTATGLRTTKEEELAKLADQHPIIEDVLQFRELQKLLSTYVEKMLELIQPDGRLRAEFLQAGTVTGRMGCKDPNLQNIPIRTEYGRRIRSAFVAPQGFSLLSLDYSQIELRIAAGLSGDEKLIGVFTNGGDIHTAVAASVFNVPREQVDKEMRRKAKVINFGILYGMGVNALKQNLGSGTLRDDAQRYLDEYFASYPQLAAWIETTKQFAAKNGYVETAFGRRRALLGMKSKIPAMRAQAERFAVNAPIQGTQADIIKLAMVKADELIEKRGWRGKANLLMQIHDELVYEVSDDIAAEAAAAIRGVMESVAPDSELSHVPIIAEAKKGKDWGELQAL